MSVRSRLQSATVSVGLVLALLAGPFCMAQQKDASATPAPDSTPPSASSGSTTAPANTSTAAPAGSESQASPELPDSPGSLRQRDEKSSSQQPFTQLVQQSQQQQATPHVPLGTAAAESVPTSGVAASRPAGAALAPAKQRRVRSILIKVGALVGVGVAIGTTMALSQGSPSKPPGAN